MPLRWLKITVFLVSLHYRYIYSKGSECVGLICENGGTVVFDSSGSDCICMCPSDVTGLLCEYHIRKSSFPAGPYAIPMSKDGCPEGPAHGWGRGNINITTRLSLYEPESFPVPCQAFVHEMQPFLKQNNPGFRTDILGPFDQYTLQMNFCFKLAQNDLDNETTWPLGNYGVFGSHKGCPTGLSSHELSVCFPPVLHCQTDGHVPAFDINERSDGSELKFIYCRHQENVQESDNFVTFSPYMVIKDPELATYGCPEYGGYETVDESFPMPMPTTMEGFNTTYPGNQYEHFQFGYCHSIPSHFKMSDKYNADGYSALFQRGGFPGAAYPLVEVTTEKKYGCDKMGPQLCESELAQTWIMVDIRKAILVSVVMIFGDERFEVDLSHIFVADQKWSFLNDGALLCRHNGQRKWTVAHVFRCYKPQYGRFVTLFTRPHLEDGNDDWNFSETALSVFMYNTTEEKGLGPLLDESVKEMEKKYEDTEYLRDVSAEIASVINYTDIESKSCKQEIGMQDFGIRDVQLTASSWQPLNPPSQARPQYYGWCADSSDIKPFIQVDLVFITWIDGIVLINWSEIVETNDDNIFGRKQVARGSASIHIQYGSDTHKLHSTGELTYDTSKEFGDPQTFLFSDPFFARYLRMYPRAFHGTNVTCMRFEILGCRNSDSMKVRCGEKSQRKVSRVNRLLIPNNGMASMYRNLTSSECEAQCLYNLTDCLSTIYSENGSCFLYTIDDTNNYVTIYAQENRDTLSMMFCLLDTADQADTFKLKDNGWKIYMDSNVTKPGVLTNTGYPLTYAYNSVYRWKIDFPEKFVTLQFMDISLRLFKDNSRRFLNNCRDTIFISRKNDEIMWNPFQDFTDQQNFVVNSDHNGRTPAFSMASSDIRASNYLTFYSCSYGSLRATGRGFRVHVSGTEQPYCLSEETMSFCLLPVMELISRRFLGRHDGIHSLTVQGSGPETHSWLIMMCLYYIEDIEYIGEPSLLTTLEMKDFDISCHSESYFQISIDNIQNTNAYCNGNRPFGKQTILTGLTEVLYTPSQLKTEVFPEGFRLAYKCIPKHEMWLNATPVHKENTDGGVSTKQVCVPEQNKCYTIYTMTSKSWNDVAIMCQESNASMVNIKTQEEMILIRSILIEHYNNNGETYSVASELFIGLHRYVDYSGVQHEHWTDGAPMTFTAWDAGEPSDTIINQCTKMGFHQPNKDHTWRTVPCNKKYGNTGREMTAICEYKTHNSEGVFEDLSLEVDTEDGNFVDPKDMATLHKCESGEWILSTAKCNGFAECLDLSDEKLCEERGSCTQEEFQCTNGRCIHVSKVCDFVDDCNDASDEFCEFPSCAYDEFTCANRECISSEERCDSVKHCLDGSDELNCENKCVASRAFQCSDKSCISKRLVCDIHIDCPDGADERSCDREYETCDELWRDGYTTNGYFRLGQAYSIYCNFDDLEDGWGTIEMTYPNVDWKQMSANEFRIDSPGIDNALDNSYECTQKFSMIPHRERLQVLQLDNKTVPISEQKHRLDSHNSQTYTHNFKVTKTTRDGNFSSFTVTTLVDFNSFDNRMMISEVICTKFIPKTKGHEEPVLFCRDGVRPIKESQRCLYSKDENRILEGCRSIKHLQNCESFTCPQNYVKCPRSYCIPFMDVCNGRVDCPDGYDENVCACENENMNIILLIPGLSGEATQRYMMLDEISAQLGGVMYSKESTVKVIRVKDKKSSLFIWKKRSTFSNLKIESTDILMNSEHIGQPYRTNDLSSEDIGDFLLDILGPTNKDNNTGIIWLSDENLVSDEENVLSSQLDILKRDIKRYRVIIDKNVNKDVAVTYGPSQKEIRVRDADFIGTVGTQLFPEICEGKMLPCNGGYRCLLSKVCIPLKQVCDKQKQCPYGDDERHCDFKCPEECSCGPLIIDCSNLYKNIGNLSITASPRVLKVANSTHICHSILNSESTRETLSLLISLNMSSCGIKYFDKSSFSLLQNVIILDLSFNNFSLLLDDVFFYLKSLQVLKLTGNHQLKRIEPGAFRNIKIKSLSIRHTQLRTLSADTFIGLDLDVLDLSHNKISSVQDYSFNSLTCNSIDITGNPIKEFTKNMFVGVTGVTRISTPAFKFCCIRPSYLNEDDCLPYKDEFSSCEDLLRNSTIQALMWTIGVLSVIGNAISLVYRLLYDRKRLKLGYGVFVTSLAVADLLMGIYMMMIAVADTIFRNRYIEVDEYWKTSHWCRLAGVLSTLSSEASVLFMCLITIDRILVIKYPFGQLRFKTKSAITAVLICWVFVLLISLLPILYTGYFQGKFYSKSAVCLALPLTRDRPPGWLYSVLIFIGFNMLTFILIAVGQLLIYTEVKKQASVQKSLNMTRRNDLKIARNLLLVVTTDFLCWFPIGAMGVLALTGRAIPGEVYAWTAVIVLPINSALNPFMYTLTAIYSKQKFNPSVEEQSRTDLSKEIGKSMLKIYPYVPTHKKRKNAAFVSLADLMMTRHLVDYEIIVLINRIASFIGVLHDHHLVVRNITENEVFIAISNDGKILGKIEVDTHRRPELSSRRNDQADDLYHLGCLLGRILLRRDSIAQ